jgi:hypothetical protein
MSSLKMSPDRHQDIIFGVACDRSPPLRRIAPYASVVAPLGLASDVLLLIRDVPKPSDDFLVFA